MSAWTFFWAAANFSLLVTSISCKRGPPGDANEINERDRQLNEADRLGLPVEVLDGLAEVDRGTHRCRSPETIRRETPERWHEFLASPIAYFGLSEEGFRSTVLGARRVVGVRCACHRRFQPWHADQGDPPTCARAGEPSDALDRSLLCDGISGTSIDELTVECVADQRMQAGAGC